MLFCIRINEIEKEKEYILMKTTNSLNNHAKLMEETKEFVKVYFIYYLFSVQLLFKSHI